MNTNKFLGKMKEHGFTLESLAAALGISRMSLYNKAHGIREWKLGEFYRVCKLLELSEDDIQSIFFAEVLSACQR